MPRRSGLGPQGRAAVSTAAATFERLQNPAANEAELPGEIDETGFLNWLPVTSSRVSSAAYDGGTGRLFLAWVKPGESYVYEGVTRNEWRNFRRSASPGRFVNRVLNSKDYHRL